MHAPVFQTPAIFQERHVPARAQLAGYTALAQAFAVDAPVRHPACVSANFVKGERVLVDGWTVHDRRAMPADNDFAGHLAFALRNERVDLLLLRRIFEASGPTPVEEYVRSAPTGPLPRRAWFFYEWLTGRRLDLPDAAAGNYVEALNSEHYVTAEGVNSQRHRVKDNLLGNRDFCAVVRWTDRLRRAASLRLDDRARQIVGRIDKSVLARAASFLLMADSQASFRIEGEATPQSRMERWGRAVMQAGRRPLSVDELVLLQSIVIEEKRFVRRGLREEGVFLGGRDEWANPIPEFIGARHQDVPALVGGLIEANRRMSASRIDAVVQAAITSFGFVMIHPFEDGNGRIHRCLVHHVLTERGFSPPGMIFPVSSVIWEQIDAYREALVGHSGPLMPFIQWRPTPRHNVEVLNDTGDLYRYMDATALAEFLYDCVETTVEHNLPNEIQHLRRHDEATRRIEALVEMPDHMVSMLIAFIRQNEGRLGRHRRKREFAELTDAEVLAAEQIVRDAFEIAEPAPSLAGQEDGEAEELADGDEPAP